ncbi:low-specificity L-threonine aldolase [Chitinophaga horti]|uniref:Low-specificity L-threonine aldolase n=1 Tax=Chitinophaga horti TaxID=2920382 RepID=A0ABY6J4E9_9BACT|nr:low-specificity L-threonine aldolase [Chitinophaga horti]UYQ94246.1 low-specificity L-threonine aldolase [Chitinophaga horti]
MITDLRSDTFTKPSPAMMEAMMHAATGDDVWGEDPSVNQLEAIMAAHFGMEAALYCPSGTMSNQIAIKVHTQPGDELICGEHAHVYIYEGGGIASNSGVQVKPIESDRGLLAAADIINAINPDDVHKARTSIVSLENTSNRGGGCCYEFEQLEQIREVCDRHDLALHLDGARLFNALVATGQQPKAYGRLFDSISVCLNKGMGCPMGSVLMGSANYIKQARRVRKRLGGGLRQAGYMAACGLYAMEHNISRLADDHTNAKRIARALLKRDFTGHMLPVDTNIIIFDVQGDWTPVTFTDHLRQHGVLAHVVSATQVRMVTHLDVTTEMTDRVCDIIAAMGL